MSNTIGGLPLGQYGGASVRRAIVATSGLRATGAATIAVRRHRAIAATSGLLGSGVGVIAQRRHRAIVGTSGLQASGATTIAQRRHRAIVATGGLVATGQAVVISHGRGSIVGAGGAVLSGAALVVPHVQVLDTGGGYWQNVVKPRSWGIHWPTYWRSRQREQMAATGGLLWGGSAIVAIRPWAYAYTTEEMNALILLLDDLGEFDELGQTG
jgi:hypothetical protein